MTDDHAGVVLYRRRIGNSAGRQLGHLGLANDVGRLARKLFWRSGATQPFGKILPNTFVADPLACAQMGKRALRLDFEHRGLRRQPEEAHGLGPLAWLH